MTIARQTAMYAKKKINTEVKTKFPKDTTGKGKGQDRVHPRTGHEGPEGE